MLSVNLLLFDCICHDHHSLSHSVADGCEYCSLCYDNHGDENILDSNSGCRACAMLKVLSHEDIQFLQIHKQSDVNLYCCVVTLITSLLRPQNFYPQTSYSNVDYDIPILSGRDIILSSSLLII